MLDILEEICRLLKDLDADLTKLSSSMVRLGPSSLYVAGRPLIARHLDHRSRRGQYGLVCVTQRSACCKEATTIASKNRTSSTKILNDY